MRVAGALLLLAAAGVAAADDIYPSDHWQYATKMSSEAQFEEFVKTNVDSGKAVFARWIASSG